jgi:hypothetical protein
LAKIDRKRPAGVEANARIWATPDAIFLEYENAGAYLIRGGREILVDPVADVDARIIRLFLLGPAIALLLHQRGFLVLHASAVEVAGGAVAFVGDKGAGKSTMAAAMHSRGHALIADDVVAIDTGSMADKNVCPTTSTDVPLVYPGFPQLKLFPESVAMLDAGATDLPRVHPDFDKRARRAETDFPRKALPLKAVLELIDSPRESIEAIGPQQSFMTLVRHSYVLSLLAATGAAESHFRQAVNVAGRVPVRRLLRRRALADLPAVAALVEKYVADGR